ncbi:MAG: response regulator transcription factor [Patescibacteria group bacterium]
MRLLIIDDDKELAGSMKLCLEKKGFAVDLAHNGDQASFLGRTNHYDMVLLDLVLPKRNGLDVCKEIKAEKKNTPILVLSARTETPTKIQLLNAGADDYLTKPFSFEELMARIRAILRRPQEVLGEIITAGSLNLDTKRRLVSKDERNINLTRKEFSLLEYMMRNQGVVLSRRIILEHVWDVNADPFSNTVETHILNLRKKIDADNRQDIIQTIPGEGYKLETIELK